MPEEECLLFGQSEAGNPRGSSGSRLIQTIQIACDVVIVELGRMNAFPDPLRKINLMHPAFEMNKHLPADENV